MKSWSLREIRRIQMRTKHLVDTLLLGSYRSAFKGIGMEFEEVRPFQPGDDVRYIDWNVTARSGAPHVKTFREERALTVLLVVDISASGLFGSTHRSKSSLMAEIGALLAFSAIENQDKIGLLLFSSRIEKYLPPKKGLRHALRVVRELLVTEPQERGTDLGQALSFLRSVQRRTCICFVLSDFLTTGYEQALKVASKHYDLIAVRVSDPGEKSLPPLKLVTLQDLEAQQERLVDLSNPAFRAAFAQQVEQRLERQDRLFHQLGVGLIDLQTDQTYEKAIHRFFKSREKRHR